jgi:hypothetical protein
MKIIIKDEINAENGGSFSPPLKHDLSDSTLGREKMMRKRHYHMILIRKLINTSSSF